MMPSPSIAPLEVTSHMCVRTVLADYAVARVRSMLNSCSDWVGPSLLLLNILF